MKIIVCNKFFYHRGGDCIHSIQLKRMLESKGHEVAIFSMQYTENIENMYTRYWPSEISFTSNSPLKLFSALKRPFGVNEVRRKWQKLLFDFKPHIVHLHNIHSQLSPIIAQIANKQNIPVIWTLHDYKLLCPASAHLKTNGQICEECINSSLSVIRNKCVKESYLASFIGYFEAIKWNKYKLESYVSKFIAPSSFLKLKMRNKGYHPNNIIQLYNFVEDDKFQNKIFQTRKAEVVYVGRISVEKGIATLCKAFKNINDANLFIIGDGPLKAELEHKYANDRINFLGFQPWSIIKQKLEQASFMVIPSEWYENNPLTIIEAFSLGTPVLGAKIGGITELIENGINGMTFESKNTQELSHQIEKMLSYKNWNYQQIQDDAKIKFSANNYYNSLLEIYNQAISNGVNQ